ncbi:MAG TPA: TatD family hydrolase [Firmicutes bacterium]|nr:TatD family hydrolase [Bacillota bacterium]
MIKLVDSHAHLNAPEFKDDLEEVFIRAQQAGVAAVIDIGTGVGSSRRAISLALNYPRVKAAVGFHPHDAARVSRADFELLAGLAENPQVVAIGETGLDFYRHLSPPHIQEQIFRQHLRLAVKLDKPVIIHSREAFPQTFRIIKDEPLPSRRGVMHCFNGDRKWAQAFLKKGFYLSLAGPVTYPRSSLQELLKSIPLDRLLLETDCPYLAPQAFRGRRNEPAYITETYLQVAQTLGLHLEELAGIIWSNACRLFGTL